MREGILDSAFLLGGDLSKVDPSLELVIGLEGERQVDKLVMIASESVCPPAVRQALGSVFTNIYAEGYPARRTQQVPEPQIADVPLQMAYHRRYGDRRYYKGTEYVDLVESLAQRRVAELFATDKDPDAEVRIPPEGIYANVQALSGAAANNAVYTALLEPGDTIMGLNLSHGGHLTHGSPANRSGRYYHAVAYGVSPATGRIDYDALEATAREFHPKLIVAGASAYPWEIDWRRLRQIADSLPERAYLLADIAHPAGLVVAGKFPNPIGYADVVTFTTHKTMIGPRAAVILSTDRRVARRIDRAVFPGEQGGPHENTIAAMAVAFKLAQTPEFRRLQESIVENAQALASGLTSRGLRLAYGGTNTHLLLVDLKAVETASGVPLNGDLASRVLDVAGIVCNKNTIAGDTSAVYPSGLRFGTTWLTQRGFGPAEMDRVAGLIHDVLAGIETFEYRGGRGAVPRGKVRPAVLAEAREGVAALVARTPDAARRGRPAARETATRYLLVRGPRAGIFLQEALAADILALASGEARPSLVYGLPDGQAARVAVGRLSDDAGANGAFLVAVPSDRAAIVQAWLQDLSDGYVLFDQPDPLLKIDGPAAIEEAAESVVTPVRESLSRALAGGAPAVDPTKPYFVGQRSLPASPQALPEYRPSEEELPLRRTALYSEHVRLGARMVPFGGWEMPIWYTSIGEEHQAVRKAAGLFDLAHMGVLEVSGPDAARFLDLVTTNYVLPLEEGKAQYSYLLDPDGKALDDILIYRRGPRRYMLVVNASNAERDEAWLRAVRSRQYLIDRERPDRRVDAAPEIRDLRDPSAGEDRRIDLALQGPRSLEILKRAITDQAFLGTVGRLGRFGFAEGEIAGIPVLVARTGYTGERLGYEIYVHPERAADLWHLLLDVGRETGLRPIGLGARDSLRTEAGFPLYGHELAGDRDVSPFGAGYPGFVKLHKPFFVGREALRRAEGQRKMAIVRFRMNERGSRMARPGDPVIDRRGECIGFVTSSTAIEGVQFGLAYVDRSSAEEGTPIGVFPLGAARGRAEKAKGELKPGDRVLVHEPATVQKRFM